jgi:hypothetical protein
MPRKLSKLSFKLFLETQWHNCLFYFPFYISLSKMETTKIHHPKILPCVLSDLTLPIPSVLSFSPVNSKHSETTPSLHFSFSSIINLTLSFMAEVDTHIELVISCVMQYITDAKDRDPVSLVCRQWYELERSTRKEMKISFCYTVTPSRMVNRFPYMESLKLKGQPRAAIYGMIPEDWGCQVGPWISKIAPYSVWLTKLHFR